MCVNAARPPFLEKKMRKSVMHAGLLLLVVTTTAQAQIEQSVLLSNATVSTVDLTIRVRNTQAKNAGSIFSIYQFYTSFDRPGVPCNTGSCAFGWNNARTAWTGNFDSNPFTTHVLNTPFSDVVTYSPTAFLTFEVQRGADGHVLWGGGVQNSRPGVETWGILGCVTPTFEGIPGGATRFNGRNCLEDGLDGFFNFTVTFLSPTNIDARTLVASDFSAYALGQSTALVTPEPGTVLLTASGLLAVAGVTRRRRIRRPVAGA
jgi:hypothetical protein